MADRRRLQVFIACCAALSPCRTSYCEESQELRVLTYNIHHCQGTDGVFDYERIAEIIKQLKPDVVALQEIDRKTQRASDVDQAARLAELTGMRGAFGAAMNFAGGHYGEAILSRFPLENARTLRLPFRFGQEPRAALVVRIVPDNGLPTFELVGTHFCHQSGETRFEQASHLHGRVGDSDLPVVLAGDLNARPGSKPIAFLLENGWIDAIAPRSRIDYVLYRKRDPWEVVEVEIADDLVASDHRPVLAVLRWTARK